MYSVDTKDLAGSLQPAHNLLGEIPEQPQVTTIKYTMVAVGIIVDVKMCGALRLGI
jgi:hypothetical protein